MASHTAILCIWILCMIILGIFVYWYLKRKQSCEGFDVVSDFKEYIDIAKYTNVESPDVLYVAQGDYFLKQNLYDDQVFSSPTARKITIHVPPRIPPRCSVAPATATTADTATATPSVCAPAPNEIKVKVSEIMDMSSEQFQARFKSIIDSTYLPNIVKNNPASASAAFPAAAADAARKDFLKEGRQILFKSFPLSLAAFTLLKYKGDKDDARDAILFDTENLQKEQAETASSIGDDIKVVARGIDANKTPENEKFSTRLAAYALAKNSGNVYNARQDILRNTQLLTDERIEIDYKSIMSQQDISGISQLVSNVVYAGPKDDFQTVFPRSLSQYALAVYELDPVAARKALFSNYNGLQANLSTKMFPEAEKQAWAKDPRGKTCERLTNLVNYFNARKAGLATSLGDLSGAAIDMSNAKRENKKFQYGFEKVCTPLMKADRSKMSPSEKTSFDNCILMASVDPILYPIVRSTVGLYDLIGYDLYTAESDFGTVLKAFDKISQIIGCGSSVEVPTFAITEFGSSNYENKLYPTTDMYSNAAVVVQSLNDLSPYYLAPEILDFITKYLLQATEIDKATATINTYLDGTDQNRTVAYGIVLDLAKKQATATATTSSAPRK